MLLLLLSLCPGGVYSITEREACYYYYYPCDQGVYIPLLRERRVITNDFNHIHHFQNIAVLILEGTGEVVISLDFSYYKYGIIHLQL